jgi:hypothetical protein
MTTQELSVLLRLSIQRALLDRVSDRLSAVTCGIRGKRIIVVAYFIGDVTADDIERIREAGAEIIADFPEDFTIEERCQSRDEEEEMLDYWVFRRAEV